MTIVRIPPTLRNEVGGARQVEADGETVLRVVDNGAGIPSDERDNVFRRLYRMDKSRTTSGSGLGLTLAQTFVQQHHGLVECDSVPGRTDFKILIPLP